MGLARKCDRCGKLYESYNIKNDSENINGLITVNVDDDRKYYSHGVLDLCPECSGSFMKWFKEKGE